MNNTDNTKVIIINDQLKNIYKKLISFPETTVLFSIIVVSLVISVLSPYFLTKSNFISTAISLSSEGVIAIGITIVLISGGLDLSVGSIMTLSGVITGILYINGINIWAAFIIAMIVVVIFGFINGFFIGKVGLNPFITTLAIAGIVRGLSYILTEGSPISIRSVPKSFSFISQGKFHEIPLIIIFFIILTIVSDFMLRKSELFRKIFYTGSNEKAAFLSGINISKIKIIVYIISSLFAGLAGILLTARFSVVTPSAGIGAEMRGISAAVIGGASFRGGEGTILGAVLGVILLSLINNGLILLNVPVYWQDFVNGLILILAVTIDYKKQSRQRRI